jgi:hypothetical protein
MTAANITFTGGGDLETLNWGGLDFPVGIPVLVDPDTAETGEQRRFYEYMIIKAKTHPSLTIEEVTPAAGRKSKSKAKDEELVPEDKNGDDDFADDYFELPKDWRSMHHKKLIALARKLGGEDEALATRDGAIAFIEERVALEGNTLHLEHQ